MAIKETIWAFDLGKASIGEAVRKGNTILHAASWIIPEDFASTTAAAVRRRMHRTRQAHRERERWLEQVWRVSGLEVLYGRNRNPTTGEAKIGEPGDPRLEREFSTVGDSTCYTSCLLRIRLLNGVQGLHEWQIFKALRSAIQKRGYGPLPWAEREIGNEEEKDEAYIEAGNRWQQFKKLVPPPYHFPCYYDAYQMGLWDPQRPGHLKERIDHTAESTRQVRFDRADVVREIQALAIAAVKCLPKLAQKFDEIREKGWMEERANGKRKIYRVAAATFADFLCYGPAGTPFASYDPDTRKAIGLRRGTADDWMGVLGQKIPRFDNRMLDRCTLIPRFHVCKAEVRKDARTGQVIEDTLLPAEVTFLMKLKNVQVSTPVGERKLTVEEIRKIFDTASTAARTAMDKPNWQEKVVHCFALRESDWSKRPGIKELLLSPLPGYKEIKPPRATGRSSFSRPALCILKKLILSGEPPKTFHERQLKALNGNNDERKGLVPEDLRFLTRMGDTWQDLFIPAEKLEAIVSRNTPQGTLDKDSALKDLLATVNDPVVRHRLKTFASRVRYLQEKFGPPDEVALEFIREDFMGEKRKLELIRYQRERERQRKDAREQAQALGALERSAPLKYELFKAQRGLCLYCGQAFAPTELQNYDIDHIVPQQCGGPDAMINYVLAHRDCNEAKGDRTPYQWKHGSNDWDAYKRLVESCASTLRKKKVQLLIREDAPELVERYTSLAETAWISKLAQTIVSFHFGWKNGVDDQRRKRVRTISGGLTARIRRRYRLNSLLNPCPQEENPLLWEERCEKNRKDQRHHALDAMIISFIPGWARDRRREGFFRFPNEIQNPRDFFNDYITKVVPENLHFEKAILAETIYGGRNMDGRDCIVQRRSLLELGFKTVQLKKKYDLTHLRKQIEAIIDPTIQKLLTQFASQSEADWRTFCRQVTIPRKDGNPGPRIKAVLVKVGKPKEYKDLSKDGTGAYRKGLKGHKGQIVYMQIEKGRNGKTTTAIKVEPVYAFDSVRGAFARVSQMEGARVLGFFQTGCLVAIDKAVEHKSFTLKPGLYRLNTIKTRWQQAKMTTLSGDEIPVMSLSKLVPAGFRRVTNRPKYESSHSPSVSARSCIEA